MAATKKGRIDLAKRNRLIEKYWPSDEEDERQREYPTLPFELAEVWKYVPKEGFLDLKRLRDNPESFVNMSPKQIAKVLSSPVADDSVDGEITISLDEFFDGNNDPASVATNLVGTPRYPGLSMVRQILDQVRAKPEVVDVRLSVTDIPNPDVPEDDGLWLPASAIFVWTTAPIRQVRKWLAPLNLDGIKSAKLSTARGPNRRSLPPNTHLYMAVWD